MHNIGIVDDISPEDVAMLQALYSRSSESYTTHLDKVKELGSGKFMDSFYTGYGHKSIGDCGTTTLFIEDVSLLAAKAIQDWPLYSGQETSTRYINMSERDIIDPINNSESRAILGSWMRFYKDNQGRVEQTVRFRHPIQEGESPSTYDKAVKARTFDVMRGFLPAGITTQLSWHTNLRQAGDHLLTLVNHPSPEISSIADTLKHKLNGKYPSSGFLSNTSSVSGVGSKDKRAEERSQWGQMVARNYAYQDPWDSPLWRHNEDSVIFSMNNGLYDSADKYYRIIETRPRGCILPHFLSDLGQCHFSFLLDFGSFRDIQRHRNGVCRMPILTTNYGFEKWYIEQLDIDLKTEAQALIDDLTSHINNLTADPVIRQYYMAIGFKVRTDLTYSLPAAVYVMELRSGKTVHPTLRMKVHKMIQAFQTRLPFIPLHVDLDPNDWDIRRGLQTITSK